MPKWAFSLQFRLVLAIISLLVLALGAVGWYTGAFTRQETARLQGRVEQVRAGRVHQLLVAYYQEAGGWRGVQVVLRRMGRLYGWRLLLVDARGQVVADSHPGTPVPPLGLGPAKGPPYRQQGTAGGYSGGHPPATP